MADIVKKGRPQGKTSSTSFMPSDVPYTSHNGVTPNMSQHIASPFTSTTLPSESDAEFHGSQGHVVEYADDGYELDTGVEHYDPHNEWSVVEESTIFETSDPSASYADPSASYADPATSSTLHADESDLQLDPHVDEIQVPEENVTSQTLPSESTIQIGNCEDDFQVDNGLRKTTTSYQPQRHTFEHEEGRCSLQCNWKGSFHKGSWLR